MGRFRDAPQDEPTETGIDMSPLIDCVFILLIFFIVTTVFVEEPGVEVNKPRAVSSKDLEKNSILLAITPSGEVFYGGRGLPVNAIQTQVKRLLKGDPNMPVIIQADTNAPSEVLVKVVGEAELAGAKSVNVAAKLRR